MEKIKASIIIPVRTITPYLRETVDYLNRQSTKNFEIILVTDKEEELAGVRTIASGEPTPAFKRNLGAKIAKGEILAFLDDDSYPCRDWLKSALKIFQSSVLSLQSSVLSLQSSVAAVCGPILTPPSDNIYQKASGWVWGSWLGSGGAGVYRNRIMPRREVDDFPSVNLLVRKADFIKVGGFDVKHWPGEDTKLCLDLTKKLGKKIIYDPKVLVYHHRRPVLLPHLKQISRYAQRRGFFAKKFPETSFRLGYLTPTFFAYGLLLGGIISLFSPLLRQHYYLLFTIFELARNQALLIYFLLLTLSGFEVLIKEKSLYFDSPKTRQFSRVKATKNQTSPMLHRSTASACLPTRQACCAVVYLAVLVMVSIFATHLVYGFLFPVGFLKKDLGVVPHKVDFKSKKYVGG